MIYLGTVGWRYRFWAEKFYPTDNKDEWLSYYANKSLFTEIRSTFSHWPTEQEVEEWNRSTPDNFVFCVSLPKDVTYNSENIVNEETIKTFYEKTTIIKKKMGLSLLHFPLKLQNTDNTLEFVLETLDTCKKYFTGDFVLNLVNRSWSREEIKEEFSKRSAILISSDKHPALSVMRDKSLYYLRLIGDTRLIRQKDLGQIYHSRESDLNQWADHLKLLNKRHQNIFVAIDNHFSGNSIRDLMILSKQLQQRKLDFTGFKVIPKKQKTIQ